MASLSCPHGPASAQVAKVLVNGGEVIETGATPVLDEIGDVLRHRSRMTTTLHACCGIAADSPSTASGPKAGYGCYHASRATERALSRIRMIEPA